MANDGELHPNGSNDHESEASPDRGLDRGDRAPATATRRRPERVRALEERLLETKGQLAQASARTRSCRYTLREAREHIATLRDEVDKLTQPPSAYGVVVGKNDDDTVDILTSGRKMRVALHPDIDHETPRPRF